MERLKNWLMREVYSPVTGDQSRYHSAWAIVIWICQYQPRPERVLKQIQKFAKNLRKISWLGEEDAGMKTLFERAMGELLVLEGNLALDTAGKLQKPEVLIAMILPSIVLGVLTAARDLAAQKSPFTRALSYGKQHHRLRPFQQPSLWMAMEEITKRASDLAASLEPYEEAKGALSRCLPQSLWEYFPILFTNRRVSPMRPRNKGQKGIFFT